MFYTKKIVDLGVSVQALVFKWELHMSNIKTSSDGKHYYYGWLWAFTIGLGLIGLVFANHYIQKIMAEPEYSERYLSDLRDWITNGSLLFFVLFYFYFKALGEGLNRQRHISTFIKLTIWSTVVVLAKIAAVTGPYDSRAYMLAAIAHLDLVVTFGILIFPVTTLYMIIDFIRYNRPNFRFIQMIGFIQKFRTVFILLVACGLIFLGLATQNGAGFAVFSLPGILLGLLVLLKSTKIIKLPDRTATSDSLADELLKWHQLKEKGVISDEEFEKKKLELFN